MTNLEYLKKVKDENIDYVDLLFNIAGKVIQGDNISIKNDDSGDIITALENIETKLNMGR